MRHNADNKFTALVLRAVFALSLLLAAASLAREVAPFAAGLGVYENAEQETVAHLLRVEEFRLKKAALRARMENDKMTARRLQARAKRLYDEAERLEARAERATEDEEAERLEAAAERLEKQADDLDNAADDLRDSAEDAQEKTEEADSQAALSQQLADALGEIAGRWECEDSWTPDEEWLQKTKNNGAEIDVEPSDRVVRERFDIFSDYTYARQHEQIVKYAFSRKKKFEGDSHEFKINVSRIYSEKDGGQWKALHYDDEIRVRFGRDNVLVETGDLEGSAQRVEIDPLIWRNKLVQNWENIPALESEMRVMKKEVAGIFSPGKLRFEFDDYLTPFESAFNRSFAWWGEHCKKIE